MLDHLVRDDILAVQYQDTGEKVTILHREHMVQMIEQDGTAWVEVDGEMTDMPYVTFWNLEAAITWYKTTFDETEKSTSKMPASTTSSGTHHKDTYKAPTYNTDSANVTAFLNKIAGNIDYIITNLQSHVDERKITELEKCKKRIASFQVGDEKKTSTKTSNNQYLSLEQDQKNHVIETLIFLDNEVQSIVNVLSYVIASETNKKTEYGVMSYLDDKCREIRFLFDHLATVN